MKDEGGSFKYYEDNQIQGISLPYSYGFCSLVVLLPNQRYGLTNLENKLNLAYFSKVLSNLSIKSPTNPEAFLKIKLLLPKFRVETEFNLKSSLKELGIRKIFNNEGDFGNISDNKIMSVDINHKSVLEISEEQTKAAAVTSTSVITGYSGTNKIEYDFRTFNANHPFLFFIIDNQTKSILFMGRFIKS